MFKHFLLIAIILSLAFTTTGSVLAQTEDCKPLYGGGETDEKACEGNKIIGPTNPKVSPTPLKAVPTLTPKKAAPTASPKKPTPTPTGFPTTKGGLKVQPPITTDKTPSTGPEALGIMALLPAAGLGYYLRKKQ